MKIAIIRNINDAENIIKVLEQLLEKEFDGNFLESYLSKYTQYAFNIESGDILCAIGLNNELLISDKLSEDFAMDYENENFHMCAYNKNEDIIAGINKNNNLEIAGNIIYDSLI